MTSLQIALRHLHTLTHSAARFEQAVAHHKQIEAERKALQEAISDAQLLLLSIQHPTPLEEAKSMKAVPDSRIAKEKGDWEGSLDG
jgi:hypothetical protein